MVRVWVLVGTVVFALGVAGTIYGKGYFECKGDVKVAKAESIIEGNKADAKTEKEVLSASDRNVDKRFSKWVRF